MCWKTWLATIYVLVCVYIMTGENCCLVLMKALILQYIICYSSGWLFYFGKKFLLAEIMGIVISCKLWMFPAFLSVSWHKIITRKSRRHAWNIHAVSSRYVQTLVVIIFHKTVVLQLIHVLFLCCFFYIRYSSLPFEGFVILVCLSINLTCVARENSLRYWEIPQRVCNLLEKLKGKQALCRSYNWKI